MPRDFDNGNLITSAASSIANNGNAVEGTDFTGVELHVRSIDRLNVQLEADGTSGSNNGDVIAYLVGSLDGTNLDTLEDTDQAYAEVAVPVSGSANGQRATSVIDVAGLWTVKIVQIDNNSGDTVNNVTARYSYTYEVF